MFLFLLQHMPFFAVKHIRPPIQRVRNPKSLLMSASDSREALSQ